MMGPDDPMQDSLMNDRRRCADDDLMLNGMQDGTPANLRPRSGARDLRADRRDGGRLAGDLLSVGDDRRRPPGTQSR